jgi:hypothetical protein
MDGWRLHTLFGRRESGNKVTLQGHVLIRRGVAFLLGGEKLLV